jgi:hypothetical protein
MAAGTIAIQTQETTLLETLATHIFENHGEEIGNAAIKKNFTMMMLDKKGSRKLVDGGLDFAEPVLISENTNFANRSHYTDIDAAHQDPTREFKFDPKTFSGSIVLNTLHDAQNQGKSAIKKWMKTLRTQADTTISNTLNDDLWTASPTDVDPESIRSIVSDTPTTGTLGGITRAGNTYAQNGAYTTAIADIGSEAGLSVLHSERATMGGDAKTNPDIAVTTPELWGGLFGFMDALRRVRADEKVTALGFDNFYIGTALLGYDDGCPDDHFYYLNSRHLFYKILRKGNFVFEPFSRKENSLNSTSIFYLFRNLTTNLPSAHKVLTNVSTT